MEAGPLLTNGRPFIIPLEPLGAAVVMGRKTGPGTGLLVELPEIILNGLRELMLLMLGTVELTKE